MFFFILSDYVIYYTRNSYHFLYQLFVYLIEEINPAILKLSIDCVVIRSEPHVKALEVHIDQGLSFKVRKLTINEKHICCVFGMLNVESNFLFLMLLCTVLKYYMYVACQIGIR